MKILVVGFYGHKNFGDECFVIAFNNFLNVHDTTYIEAADLSKHDLVGYDCVVVGGGDLLNDFYGGIFLEKLTTYHGYKIAIGVGISFEECAKKPYIDVFDDIILRNRKYIPTLSKILGTQNTHYMPDLAFNTESNIHHLHGLHHIEKTGKNIGFFLVGSMISNPCLTFTLKKIVHWLLGKGYIINLFAMYAEEGIKDNDLALNKLIYDTFPYNRDQIINHPYLDFPDFIRKVNMMDLAICVRFHAHIFCTILGVPFISIPLTHKVEIYLEELPWDTVYRYKCLKDSHYNLQTVDYRDGKDLFNKLLENKEAIRASLLYFADINKKLWRNSKIPHLLEAREKRICRPYGNILVSPESIYVKYRNMFLSRGVNHLTDDCTKIMSSQTIDNIADMICYDITNDTSNTYAYGTRINLRHKLHELRDIIYWIYQDFESKTQIPKINIGYIKQDSFQGLHRAGWHYATSPLYYYSGNHGVYFDTYLDRTFGYSSDLLTEKGLLPYTNYWVGFFHHTFDEEFSPNNCEAIFKKSIFKASLVMCKGIYCLTHYLGDLIRKNLIKIGFGNIPVNVLHHPTIFTKHVFDYDKYLTNENRSLINVGSWYRNPVTLYRVAPTIDHEKLDTREDIQIKILRGKRMDANFCPSNVMVNKVGDKLVCDMNIWTHYYIKYVNSQCDEYSTGIYNKLTAILGSVDGLNEIDIRNYEGEDLLRDFLNRVEIISELSNHELDMMYTENIIFLDLVDASTANTILECIVRSTPVVVNRIPPTVELLGKDYPLYYDDINEVRTLITPEKVKEAWMYMEQMDKSIYTIDDFVDSVVGSSIYKSL